MWGGCALSLCVCARVNACVCVYVCMCVCVWEGGPGPTPAKGLKFLLYVLFYSQANYLFAILLDYLCSCWHGCMN
uniref:Secreted protein n=1 Tax=Anguilla anguilla TaxID=7936 RepID=A0A0E9X581_ANGAN